MQYSVYLVLLFIGNTCIAMNRHDTICQQLVDIIHQGTLEEFKTNEPIFKVELNCYDIMMTQQLLCSLRLEALEKVRIMEENLTVKQMVFIIHQKISSLSVSSSDKYEYMEAIKILYKAIGTLENQIAVNTAINIVEYLISGSSIGASIQKIISRLEYEPDPQKYVYEEQQKLLFIQQSLSQMIEHRTWVKQVRTQ